MRTLPEIDDAATSENARLTPCEIASTNGTMSGVCGTLVVPERYNSTESRQISIPIQRIRAPSPDPDALPIVYLGNGPGQSNFTFRPPKALVQKNDFVQMGFRGIDSSVTLECHEVAVVARQTPALTHSHLDAIADATRSCLERLAAADHTLSDFDLSSVARDLQATIELFEYPRVHLLTDGFGIQSAIAFAIQNPSRVARVVSLSPAPLGPMLLSSEDIQSHLQTIANRCALSTYCKSRSEDLLADLASTREFLPSRWWFSSLDPGRISLVTALSLSARESTVRTIDAWQDAANGSPAALATMSWLGDNLSQNVFVWGDALAKTLPTLLDTDVFDRSKHQPGKTMLGSPIRLMLFGGLPPGLRPKIRSAAHARATTAIDLSINALFVHGTLDPTRRDSRSTLAPRFQHVDWVTIEDAVLGSEAWATQPNELSRVLTRYLNYGSVDTRPLVRHPWKFAPKLKFGTMHRLMTAATFLLPVLLGGLVFLLFRRVKRALEIERAHRQTEHRTDGPHP